MDKIYKCIGASNHTDKEREKNDFYATDPVSIDKLLTVESPSNKIWECAAGDGHLAQHLKERGFDVFSSDIIERNYKLDMVADFLTMSTLGLGSNEQPAYDILTNPPYKYAKEFVLKALDILSDGRKVYMFLKLTFLEGKARFKEIFSKYPPEKIYVFSERVLCAKNAEFTKMREGGGSAVAYAWFVWKKGYTGDTIVKWI